jgi:autotransporter-associated beta strand protein
LGTLILTADNTFSGTSTVSAGTLQLGNGGATGKVVGNIINNSALFFNHSVDATYGGVISGTGGLTKLASNTLTLSGVNSYTGATTLSEGTLAVSGSLSDTTQVSVANGAVYRLDVSDTVGSIEGAGNITTGAASGTVTLTASLDSLLTKTFSGVMSSGSTASLAFSKSGAGSLTLTGGNTYTGGTTLTAGTLVLGASDRLPSVGALSISGGTLSMDAFNQTVGALNMTGGAVTGTGTLSSANYAINVPTGSTISLPTLISGSTAINKTGDGILELTGNNTYTGGTVLTAGTLSLGSANAIGTTGTISFNGGILQFTSSNSTDYSARFNTAANQAYKFDTNGLTITMAGALASSGGTLGKYGAGNLLLTDASRYGSGSVGATTIAAGTISLRVAHPTDINAAAIFSGAGTLSLENSNSGSTTGFSSAVTTSSDLRFSTGGSALGGLVVGRTGNTADITVDGLPNTVAITGSQSYFGGNVTVPASANTSITNWSNSGTLTLSAYTSININAAISVSGTGTSGVTLMTNQGGTGGNYGFGLTASGFAGGISFTAPLTQVFKTQDGVSGTLKSYTLVAAIADIAGSSGSSTNYALANDIDASAFVITVPNSANYLNVRGGSYSGTFAGLGHTISRLSLGTTGTSNAGFFNSTGNGAIISDLRLSGATVNAGGYSGILIGSASDGLTLRNLRVDSHGSGGSTVNSSVSGLGYDRVGGLVGNTGTGTLSDVYVLNTTVSGGSNSGGVLGYSGLTITGLHKTGNMTSNSTNVGGLVGNQNAIVSYSDSAGTVTNNSGNNSTGGLLGYTNANITNSWSSGQVNTNHGNFVGGLVGYVSGSRSIIDSYSTATVTGSNTNWVGGLGGYIDSVGTLIRSYASGTVSGAHYVGGLLGGTGNTFSAYNTYFSGNSVTGSGERVGGLVGHVGITADVRNSYVTASLIQGSHRVGGLVGLSGWGTNILSDSANGYTPISPYSTASVNATGSEWGNTNAGGLVGDVGHTATVTDAYMTGSSVSGAGNYVGGLVGYADASNITRSYASGTTVKGTNYVGGLTGNLTSGGLEKLNAFLDDKRHVGRVRCVLSCRNPSAAVQ